uniref:ArsR family transcriptional regulator n=1 Tax=Anaerolinea thermolimosa TaxID=229919 RepID=A0A7C4PI94_9CHLR
MEVQMDYPWLARMFRALGNPVRIEILIRLAQGPLCVSDLVRYTSHRQAYVSQQLMFLRSLGWVEANKEGWTVCYRLIETSETQWLNHLLEEMCSKTIA